MRGSWPRKLQLPGRRLRRLGCTASSPLICFVNIVSIFEVKKSPSFPPSIDLVPGQVLHSSGCRFSPHFRRRHCHPTPILLPIRRRRQSPRWPSSKTRRTRIPSWRRRRRRARSRQSSRRCYWRCPTCCSRPTGWSSWCWLKRVSCENETDILHGNSIVSLVS